MSSLSVPDKFPTPSTLSSVPEGSHEGTTLQHLRELWFQFEFVGLAKSQKGKMWAPNACTVLVYVLLGLALSCSNAYCPLKLFLFLFFVL